MIRLWIRYARVAQANVEPVEKFAAFPPHFPKNHGQPLPSPLGSSLAGGRASIKSDEAEDCGPRPSVVFYHKIECQLSRLAIRMSHPARVAQAVSVSRAS